MNTSEITLSILELLNLQQDSSIDCNLPFTHYGIDSIRLVELILKLQKKYSIRFTASDLVNFKSINDISRSLQCLL
ncbi:MAG: acyl carrier protein [Oligoflexia bacterium]|nr:acyl carrier protein [Oligoflexia bacterium]